MKLLSFITMKAAMAWWNSLTTDDKVRLRDENPKLRSAIEITRFWFTNGRPVPVPAPTPIVVQKMLQTPGFYVVSDTDHPDEYAFVEVIDTGVCYQLKPDTYQRDGELSRDRWRVNATVIRGPFDFLDK